MPTGQWIINKLMKQVVSYLHTHWDREWYREFDAFRFRLVEVSDEIIEKLEKNQIPYFYFDGQTAAIEDYLEIRKEKTEKVKKLIRENKLDIGPFYCSADSFLVSGELYLRNLFLGIKQAQNLGQKRFIGYIADSFGHSEKLPDVFKSFGIDKAILWRGLGELPADLNWNGINTTYLIQGYFQDYLCANLPIEKKAESIKNYLDKISAKSNDIVLLPVGGDHLGLPLKPKEQIDKLNSILKNYSIHLASPFDYFDKIRKRKNVTGEFLDNSLNFILQGVYSSRLDIKRRNAICSWNLSRIAEPFQAISGFYFNSRNMQSECDYAYKQLIKNHAHDSIYGCSTDKTSKNVLNRYERVETMYDEIIETSKNAVLGGDLSVFNLSNFEYSGVVSVKTEKKLPKWLNAVKIKTEKGFPSDLVYNTKYVPVTEDFASVHTYLIDVKNLPPFSHTKLTKNHINSKQNIIVSEKSAENEFIKVQVKNSKLTVTDKISGKSFDNFISVSDAADIGDSYNFGPLKKDRPILGKLISFKTFNKKLWGEINLKYKINIPLNSSEKGRSKRVDSCALVLTLKLFNQSKNLECRVKWKNKSKNHLLRLGINLSQKIFSTVNEDLFGTVERSFNPDFDVYSKIPAERGKEIKLNTSPIQRFVSAQGVSVITKGLSEYEVNKNTLWLTLLRSTGIISNSYNPSRGTPAGPPIETPDLQMTGDNEREFAICFTDDISQMFKSAEEFYNPTVSLFSSLKSQTFFEIDNKNILVYAVKRSGKGLALRLVNTLNKPQTIKIKTEFKIYEALCDEENPTEIKSSVKFSANEIKTVILNK